MRLSVIIPTYEMPNGIEFLERSFKMLERQTFRDFEILVTDDSANNNVRNLCYKYPVRYKRNPIAQKMGGNTNAGIKDAEGELIKILYQDDYLAHEGSLQAIVDNFTGDWLVTGCTDTNGKNHFPIYNERIHSGLNTIGSPSVLTIKNDKPLLFDSRLTWVLDCDYYKRLYERYGPPAILNEINVVIGVGEHQTTHTLPQERKDQEINYLIEKYDTSLKTNN